MGDEGIPDPDATFRHVKIPGIRFPVRILPGYEKSGLLSSALKITGIST